MRTNAQVINTNPIFILIIVLMAQSVAGCSSPISNTIKPTSQFDALGTAQAQAADIEYSPPPQEMLPKIESWIQGRSFEIESLNSTDYSDLHFLDPLLEGKRIVQLGEDNHETSEYSLMKVRLIKYLHQELGYEVIAFESSLLDNYVTNCIITELTPIEAIDRTYYEIWRTEEVLPLFEYINETSSTSSPLVLAGFDVIGFGEGFEDGPGFYYSLLSNLDSDYASEIGALEGLWKYPTSGEIPNNRIDGAVGYQETVRIYDGLADYIHKNQEALQNIYPSCPELVKVAEQAAWSKARWFEALHNSISFDDKGEILRGRDKSMAVNIMFLAEEIFPDKKIIIWAHNSHIAKQTWWQGENIVNMGTYLNENYGEDLYTIGLIGHRSTDDYRSFVYQLHLYGKPYLFVDLSLQDENSVTSSAPTQITNASKKYDALIYLDMITPHHVLEQVND